MTQLSNQKINFQSLIAEKDHIIQALIQQTLQQQISIEKFINQDKMIKKINIKQLQETQSIIKINQKLYILLDVTNCKENIYIDYYSKITEFKDILKVQDIKIDSNKAFNKQQMDNLCKYCNSVIQQINSMKNIIHNNLSSLVNSSTLKKVQSEVIQKLGQKDGQHQQSISNKNHQESSSAENKTNNINETHKINNNPVRRKYKTIYFRP